MQRLKNALRDRRGETIVEVLVAFVLLMLFLALFTASLRFARRASAQAQTTRDNAYLLTEALYPVSYTHLDVYKRQTYSGSIENDTYTFTNADSAPKTLNKGSLGSRQTLRGQATSRNSKDVYKRQGLAHHPRHRQGRHPQRQHRRQRASGHQPVSYTHLEKV